MYDAKVSADVIASVLPIGQNRFVFIRKREDSIHAMKTTFNILIGLFLLLTSCKTASTDDRKNYIESEPTFFELRHGIEIVW